MPTGGQRPHDATRDAIVDLLTPPLADSGLDLEVVDLTRAGRRSVVRVAVDKDGGVDLDDIAAATRTVSRLLDESDVMGEQPYTLEVSSPGVDRPLTLPRHWRRNRGRLVQVTRRDQQPITGRVVSADDTSTTLDVDGQQVTLAYADVAKARVQVEFNRRAEPQDESAHPDDPDDEE